MHFHVKSLFKKEAKIEDYKAECIFVEAHAQVKEEIANIKAIDDPAERLVQYRQLAKQFDHLYGNGRVQRAVTDMYIDRAGIAFKSDIAIGVSLTAVAGGIFHLLSFLPVAALFPPALIPLTIVAGVAAVEVSAAILGRHLAYRSAAKEVGLSIKQVKYVISTKALECEVKKAIKGLAHELTVKRSVDNLREKFNKSAVRTTAKAPPVANAIPAAANKPASASASLCAGCGC